MIDRSLIDLMSVYRDALVLRLGSNVDLVNPDAMDRVRSLASVFTAEQLLGALDAVTEARETASTPTSRPCSPSRRWPSSCGSPAT